MSPYNEFLEHVYRELWWLLMPHTNLILTSADSVRRSWSLAEIEDEAVIEDQTLNENMEESTKTTDTESEQSSDKLAAQNAAIASLSSDASVASPNGDFPLHDEWQNGANTAMRLDASSLLSFTNPGYLPADGEESGRRQSMISQNLTYGANVPQQQTEADMGVNLDPFSSVMTGREFPDWMGDPFFAMANSSQVYMPTLSTGQAGQIGFMPVGMNRNTDDVAGLGSNSSHLAQDAGENKQSHVTNTFHTETIDKQSTVQSVLVQSTQDNVMISNAPVVSSTNQSPNVITPTTPSYKSLEGKSTPKHSKSGRAIVPSTWLEKMNEIGSNKEPAAATSAKPNNEWMERAKQYMISLKLGEDWKACIDGWLTVEEPLSSKVRYIRWMHPLLF